MGEVIDWLTSQLGNIIGLAGLIAGFIFFWLGRRPKKFGWETISSTRIVSAKSHDLPLSIVYGGREVSSPNVIVVRVGNIGKKEICAADFDGPVRIEFEDSQLLAADISETMPEGIAPAVEQPTVNSISFTPSLLNQGEWIDFQFVTDGPDLEKPKVHARVAGQNGEMSDIGARRSRMVARVLLVTFPVVVALELVGVVFPQVQRSWWILLPAALGMTIVMMGVFQLAPFSGRARYLKVLQPPWKE